MAAMFNRDRMAAMAVAGPFVRLVALVAGGLLLLAGGCSSDEDPCDDAAYASGHCIECGCPSGSYCTGRACEPNCTGDVPGVSYCDGRVTVMCGEPHARCDFCPCEDGYVCREELSVPTCRILGSFAGDPCTTDEDCWADRCCATRDSAGALVCADRHQCLLGLGESCSASEPCPAGATCTGNGFCVAGCFESEDCGASSATDRLNVCVSSGDYFFYFSDLEGVCLPGCSVSDEPCEQWSTTCDIGYCVPDLP